MIDLKAIGWTMYYSCHCGGSSKQYWKKQKYPEYQIIIRPTKKTFRILKKNHVVVGPEWTYKLEQKMKENGIIEA